MKANKLVLVLSTLMLTGVLTGCNNKKTETKTYKVAFVEDYQGGKTTMVDVEEGKKVAEPKTPTREDGATFNGWRIGSDDTSTKFDFDLPIVQDCVFYGSWIEHVEPVSEVDELTFKRALAGCALGHATASFNKCEFSNDNYFYENGMTSGNTVYKSLTIKNDGKLEHIKGVKLDPVTKMTSNVEFFNEYDNVRNEYYSVYKTEDLYGDYYKKLKNPKTYIRDVTGQSTSKFTSLISSFLYSSYYELNYSVFEYNKDTKMYETVINNLFVDGSFKIKFENGYVTKLVFNAKGKQTFRTLLDIDVDFIDIDKTKIDFPKSLDVKVFDFANKLDSSYSYELENTKVVLADNIYKDDTEMKFIPCATVYKIPRATSGGGFAPTSQSIDVPITNEDDLKYFFVSAENNEKALTVEDNTIKGLDSVVGGEIICKTSIGLTTGECSFYKAEDAKPTTSIFKFKETESVEKTFDGKDIENLYTNKIFSHDLVGYLISENVEVDESSGILLENILFTFSSDTNGVSFSYDYEGGGKRVGSYPDIVLNLDKNVNSFDIKVKIERGYSGSDKTLTFKFTNVERYYEAEAIKFVGGKAPEDPLNFVIGKTYPFVGSEKDAVVEKVVDFYGNTSTNQSIGVKLEYNDRNIVVDLDEDNNICFWTKTIESFETIENLTLYIGVYENGEFTPLDFVKVNISGK